ncbi:hypothetical protein L226DRAFT_546568 [Lentinus tigrinus ALCF2SS1-7]|uniref:Uncharacterized protein n=1 Tax=Lentinus tigrinus ALCF2SS1-6 TaxID=1328759 RepID=A0A5C2S5J6_9APHY|nr:hypothetical protein L227DRAFT_172618 [Lentinus tigrinus ALCF2SS1-6]RPD73269.1 hypothetical protein L226DRAFT_546568 [Lentinus tigrinus ALCF2SS1-7]
MAARTPKKVDVHLPGPSPKQTPAQSASVKKPVSTRGKRAPHSRQGSVASIAREDTLVGDDSPTKPPSSAKPRSTIGRTDTEDADDASVAGEPKGRYSSRKNEAERRQFMEDDPNSGEVEAHRVFCKACNEWIDLNPSRRYIMKNWVEHRRSCKGGSERSESPSKEKAAEQMEDDEASAADGSIVDAAAIKRVKKEEDRKSFIESDPLAGEVKPDAVFCKGCQAWVKLSTGTRYSLHPWKAHVQKCSGATNRPGSKVAAAQRKLTLVNDPQAHNFTNESVECKVCNQTVDLGRQLDYDLTKWEEHKTTCSLPAPPPPAAKPVAAAGAAAPRSPPSVASTEETIVAAEAGTPRKNKRSREEDDAPERAVRQRGESYEAPQGDAPGFLDWITAPLKNFLRGFREGLSG